MDKMEEWKYGYNGIHYGFNGRMGMEMTEWGKKNGKNGCNGRMERMDIMESIMDLMEEWEWR